MPAPMNWYNWQKTHCLFSLRSNKQFRLASLDGRSQARVVRALARIMQSQITLPTSAKHALLLDSALRRTVPGTSKHDFLQRLGRSLDQFGSLTDAMLAAVAATVTEMSSL